MTRFTNKMILLLFSLFFILLLVFIGLNLLDATVSKRSLLAQSSLFTALTAPLNAATHISTPTWLKKDLAHSGILKPTAQLFPHLNLLRENFDAIRDEALASLDKSGKIMNDMYFQGIADEGWKRLYIKWHGPIDPLAKKECPFTCSLIEKMPEVSVAMFSILMPGSKILPHHGPAKMCLRYHLGLSTPNDPKCSITLNGEKYSWKDGEDVMFDDTLMHEVHNNTDKKRIILFLDVERPQEGILRGVSKWAMKKFGPMTSRSNDVQEKVLNNIT